MYGVGVGEGEVVGVGVCVGVGDGVRVYVGEIVGDGVGVEKSKTIPFPSEAVSGSCIRDDPSSLGSITAETPKITLRMRTAADGIVIEEVYIMG